MEDKYTKFEELIAEEKEGVDYRVQYEYRSLKLLVLAPHGGSIEPGTSELAKAVAGVDLSFYLFEGIKPSGNFALHITSSNFDEPKALEMLKACEKAIAIHGEKSDEEIVYIGGRDEEMWSHVIQCLKEAGFITRTHRGPTMRGTSRSNVCNRCRTGAGLQLELSRGLRKLFFRSLSRDDRGYHSELFDSFVRAVRAGIGCANTV
ncbi:MAG TPA: poly-gamma-glutamate hydrolase family protein [Nitrospirota bacterium]|nr:poly-gamma-glutamate hydrolase family protein [Nitrospirota bacterium]